MRWVSDHPHFTDKGTEPQRGEETCPKSPSLSKIKPHSSTVLPLKFPGHETELRQVRVGIVIIFKVFWGKRGEKKMGSRSQG